jgi:hypothetical protein
MNFPKVLISAPTANAKNYCFHEWIENVMNFTYPNFEVRVFDNSIDNGKNAQYLNSEYKKLFNNNKFMGYHSKTDYSNSVIERMCVSHNLCRETLLNGDYEYLLHLETDIFPQQNVIENLMCYKKEVVGAIYDRDEGKHRTAMLQKHIWSSPFNVTAFNFEAGEELFAIDGTCKPYASVGLGCVLIHKSVLQKIPFRFIKNQNGHPDKYFAEDCFRNNIKIYADTSMYCNHNNQAWGIYGIDFK